MYNSQLNHYYRHISYAFTQSKLIYLNMALVSKSCVLIDLNVLFRNLGISIVDIHNPI